MAEMVRVNTRIAKDLNEWLDKESFETGLPKSTLIMMAIEGYRREKEVIARMGDLSQLAQKIEELERKITR